MDERYDGDAERLREELRALGRSLDGADSAAGSESMVERVLGQILTEELPVPAAGPTGTGARLRAARRWTRARWRSLVASLCGLLTVLALTPPVRAAVIDWFGFGGVEVRYDPSAVPSPGAEVPGCGRSVSFGEAERRAGFTPLVPKALGTPDAVTVSGLPRGRFLVSLCWREQGRTIRLDEFPARLDVTFVKSVREQPEWLSLGEEDEGGIPDQALWFPRPHVLSFWLVDVDGHRFTREERTAGPTLLWPYSGGAVEGVTLRLEGVVSKARALEIAEVVEEAGR
ncbi:hypothetical protein [Streptomyces sp. NPDC059781]|uniref:hypothetical protein n=1 Tax=unclassified Streptomyces TaxID=2593676 RepID=UPI003651225D